MNWDIKPIAVGLSSAASREQNDWIRTEVGESSSMVEDGSKMPLWSLIDFGRFCWIWWRETASDLNSVILSWDSLVDLSIESTIRPASMLKRSEAALTTSWVEARDEARKAGLATQREPCEGKRLKTDIVSDLEREFVEVDVEVDRLLRTGRVSNGQRCIEK
jgi:hypothetical protein